ncbi:MAG: lysostaphin resistance A-like protein [Candidatus Bipolaricaulia bacterium]
MRSIFFNERRMRAGWRALLFIALLLFLFTLLFSLIQLPEASSSLDDLLIVESYLLIPVLGITYLMARYVDRRPFDSVGLWFHPHWRREFSLGALLGLLMISLFFGIAYLMGGITVSWAAIGSRELLKIFSLYLLAHLSLGAFEEITFRGYLFQSLIEGLGTWPAAVTLSFVFGLLHYSNPNATPIGTINTGLVGLGLAVAYIRTKSLWLPIGFHFTWNFLQAHLYAFPVSGISFRVGLLQVAVDRSEPAWLTGGAFGPEGSVIVTGLGLLLLAFVVRSDRLRAHRQADALWRKHIKPALSTGEGSK